MRLLLARNGAYHARYPGTVGIFGSLVSKHGGGHYEVGVIDVKGKDQSDTPR